jgi:hypothetical protein
LKVDSSSDFRVDQLLSRPSSERLKEFKYRFAQTVIFGLPLLGLQYFGPRLGGPESAKWIGILQSLLGGWIVYVGAAGMLFEGLINFHRFHRISADTAVALSSLGFYLFSLGAVLALPFLGHLPWKTLFHWPVLLLGIWSASRWWRLNRLQSIS